MRRQRIVTVGGGTGSFTLLTGLKKYPVDISAVVSMADDGGSTGVLRDELGVLPPGDVRQCLTALSQSSREMRELMTYRFEEGSLKGHSFGNLFLSALEKTNQSFSRGVESAMHILNVSGEVIPVTDQNIQLLMRLRDGNTLLGEDQINKSDIQETGVQRIGFATRVYPSKKAVRRVSNADMIIIGPGNHYCSILPNVAVKGFADAIRKTRAKVLYVCNLTNKKGHTTGWSVDDYVESLETYIGKGRVDFVLFNTRKPSQEAVNLYEASEGADSLVRFDNERSAMRKYHLVRAHIVSSSVPRFSPSDTLSSYRAFIRHDSHKLAKAIMFVLEYSVGLRVVRSIT